MANYKEVTPEEIGRSKELHKHLREFIKRYEPGPRRTAYDRLKEKGMFDSKSMANEFNKVLDGKSALSRAEREAVVKAVMDAAEKAGREINARREKEAAEKETAGKAHKTARVEAEKKSGTGARKPRKGSTSAKSAENKKED